MSIEHSRALALAREGRWDEAHELIQAHSDRTSCLIHAYLHRIEGDLGNARYWYRYADEDMPNNTLEEEWARLCAIADKRTRRQTP